MTLKLVETVAQHYWKVNKQAIFSIFLTLQELHE